MDLAPGRQPSLFAGLTDAVDDDDGEESGESTVAGEPDEPAKGAGEAGPRGAIIPAAELEDFLKSLVAGEASDAAPRRHGGGPLDGDEDGAGKRKGAASGEERGGETGERAGKKKKRSGGSQRREYKNKEMKRGEMGSQEEAPR